MKKRVVSLLMALMLLMSLLPTGVMAAGGDWTYAPGAEGEPGTLTQGDIVLNVKENAEDNTKLTVAGYQNIGSDTLDLTGTITGTEGVSYTITAIGDQAFRGCTALKSVTLPNSVTSIDHNAFASCTGLTSIKLSEDLLSIGPGAFYYCASLTAIDLPENLTSILNGAFQYCTSLRSIDIPNGVRTISQYAFHNCSSLETVSLPEGLTSLGQYSFGDCTNLTELKLPDSLESIGASVIMYTPLTELTVPAKVTLIDDRAFGYADSIRSLTFKSANPVNNLDDVLSSCSSLLAVWVPADSLEAYKAAAGDYAEKVYAISDGSVLANPGKVELETVAFGYTDVEPASVTVWNYYSDAVNVNIELEGDDAGAFQLNTGTLTVAADGSASFNVFPKTGLVPGDYTANVKITVEGKSDTITVPVSIAVTYPSDARTITVGGVELIGAPAYPAYATTDESTGVVTAQQTYTEDWNIKWDGSTLTLRNANIKGSGSFGIVIAGNSAILLEGNNYVSAGNGLSYIEYNYAVNAGIFVDNYASYGNCTIKEAGSGGSLTVSGGSMEASAERMSIAGIVQLRGSLIIESGTISAYGGVFAYSGVYSMINCGIFADECTVTVTGGKLSAIGGNSGSSFGLFGSSSTVTVSGGEVSLKGNQAACFSQIKAAPASGMMIAVNAGEDENSAAPIEGSPFDVETEVPESTALNNKYIRFITQNAELTFYGTYSIPDGTVGTTYTLATPLQAKGGEAPYIFSIATPPATGSLSISDGKLVYQYPDEPTAATITATIKVKDSSGNEATTTVRIGAALARTYALTVVNGKDTSTSTYTAGTEITLTADYQSGKQFKAWTTDPEGDIAWIDDPNAQTTTLTMPEHDLTVTAEYVRIVCISFIGKYQAERVDYTALAGDTFIIPEKPGSFNDPAGTTFMGWMDTSYNYHAAGSKLEIPTDCEDNYVFFALWGTNVNVGGVQLTGYKQMPVYASTDAGGNVTASNYTETSDWNIKWDGSTLTLKDAVIKGDCGISSDSLTEIALVGINEVTATAGSGIMSTAGSGVTLSGNEGSLTVRAALAKSSDAGIGVSSLEVKVSDSDIKVFTTGSQGAVIRADSVMFEDSYSNLELGRDSGQAFFDGSTAEMKLYGAIKVTARNSSEEERTVNLNDVIITDEYNSKTLLLHNLFSKLADDDVYIYLEDKTYTVTVLDYNGENITTNILTTIYDYILPNYTETAPEGMRFECWVDENGKTYAEGQEVIITEDTVFKAQLKAIPRVITVNMDPDVGATCGVIELEDPTEDWSKMPLTPLEDGKYTVLEADKTVILVCDFGSKWVLDSAECDEASGASVEIVASNAVKINTVRDVVVTLKFSEAQGLVVGNVTLSYDEQTVFATTDDAGKVTVQPDYAETDNWNIKWDGSTLTLRGANIKGVKQADGNVYGIYSEKNLAVTLEGSNTVTGVDADDVTNSVSAGIYSIGSIEFSGSGSLTAQGANGCTSVGIMSHDALKFTGSMQVTATGADINIDPDSLSEGSGASSILGSYVSAGVVGLGSVSIESGAAVNATGGDHTLEDGDPMSLGCYSNILKVDGGTLIAKSGDAKTSSGVICMSTIEVSNGELQAYGQQAGIDEGSRMELREGSKVTASAENSNGGAVSLLDGVYVYPTEGYAVQILAGTSEQNAQEIDGSPFTTEDVVSLKNGVTWFQSEWIEYEQHEHNLEWKSDETGHWQECTSCGYKTAVEAHTPGEWTVLTPATEDSTGLKCRDCIVCGYRIETRVIPATGSTTETSVKDIDITTGKSVVSNTNVPAGTEDIIAALKSGSVEGSGLMDAALNVAADSDAMEAAAELAQTELDTDEPVTIIIETYLEIEVIKAEQTGANTRSFTLDITAMYKLKATDGTDTVTVGEPQTLAVTSPVTLTVPMPADFGLEHDEISIRHETGGSTYVYEGSVSNEKLTFTAQYGLGRFTITAEGPVASIGSVDYTSLQTAVDAVGDKETIKVYVDGLEAVVSGNKTFYIELSGATQYPDLSAASGYVLTDDGNGTYTVSKQDQGGTVDPRYIIYVERSDNGSVSVWPGTAAAGTVITVNVKPDEGYVLDELVVTDSIGRELDVQYKDSGKYTFKMPASWVKIEASFRTRRMPFADVAENAWYTDAVRYVYEHDLMDGIGSTTFAPDATTSRAMIATILWRMAGSPAVNGSIGFSDVADGQWYSEAIRWAASEGIVAGYDNGKFGPDDPITREQFAAMLWRYAKSAGYDVSIGESTNILSYADAMNVSEYAIPAMQWACGSGVITGISEATLVPRGEATRAQAATILMRFCEKYVKW